MLVLGLILVAIGAVGYAWAGKLWRRHKWQPWFDLTVIVCFVLGYIIVLFSDKGDGEGRGTHWEPDPPPSHVEEPR